MTEQLIPAAVDCEPLPRCCASHPDWPTLSQHLVESFPDVPIVDIVREVRRAKEAVATVAVTGPDALDIGETIIRHQLLLIIRRSNEVARHPQRHVRGRQGHRRPA